MLVRSLVVCALLTLYGGATSPTSASDQIYDTIVVGLGSAGTTAASALSRAGKRVLALEAQGRVGGRVNTVPFGDGLVELGAEWIQGTENSPVYDLAIKNNISVLFQDRVFEIFVSNGSLARKELNELGQYALGVYDDVPKSGEPVGQYVTRKTIEHISSKYPELVNDKDFISEFFKWMDLLVDSVEASSSWMEVSSLSEAQNLGGHQTASWHRHGYKTFFELLLNTYNNGPGLPNLEIKLNTEVTGISWPQEPAADVVVTTADGATYRARTVIVTVSLGVLKENYKTLFSPPLPHEKITAIEKMAMGLLGKMIFSFDRPWWDTKCSDELKRCSFGFFWRGEDRAAVADGDLWLTKVMAATTPMGSSNTLTFWTAGDTAELMEALPEDEVKAKVLGLAKKFMGENTIPEPTGFIRTSWHSNRFTRGSYTYDNVLPPQYQHLRAALGAPLLDRSGAPRVLFAGEATEPKHYGYVHGASETGLREANRILQHQ